MKGTQMENQAKLGAALLGGYVLGRTKKGGFALRLATRMFLSGSQTDPKELARDNAMRLLDSDIVEQLRGQIMEAAKAAANARVEALASNLTQRAEALKTGSEAADKAAETATQSVGDVTDTVKGVTKTDQKDEDKEESDEQDEPEDQEAEDEGEEPEGEAEGADEGDAEDSEADEGDGSGDDDEPEDGADEEDEVDDDDYSEEEKQERIKELKRKRIGTLRNIAVDLGFDADEMGDIDDKTEVIEFILEAEEEDRQKGKS